MVLNSRPRPDDICEFDGDPINDIILCGRLLRRVDEPMRTQFEINDNTGTFHVLFYHKGENQVPTALRNFNYEQFCYCKVFGNIRVFKEEKAIVGTHIKRIDKFDELTNHFLATYVSHCIRKKGTLKSRELALD
jgi:RPA family protein